MKTQSKVKFIPNDTNHENHQNEQDFRHKNMQQKYKISSL